MRFIKKGWPTLLVLFFFEQYAIWKRSNKRRESRHYKKKYQKAKQINQSISERIICHVVTVTRFLRNPSRRKPRGEKLKRYLNLL